MVQENPAACVHAVFTTLSVSFDGLENSARIKVQCDMDRCMGSQFLLGIGEIDV